MNSITNQAHVTFSYGDLETTKTNSSNIVTSTMKDKYSFSVEKTATSDCFRAGDNITYFIRVVNTGCGCLSDFKLEDNLGDNENYLTFVNGSSRLFLNGTMTDIVPTTISPLVFDINGRLNRDSEFILQYTVTVNSDISSDVEAIINHVDVTAYSCGCGCDNRDRIVSEAELSIPRCEFAEVLITKAISNDNVCCDDELDYIITLTNTGNIDAVNVVVTDSLPENFTVMEIHKENNGNHYKYDSSEYALDDANLLTLPNENGTIIEVPALAPGVDNTTRIRIHGHM